VWLWPGGAKAWPSTSGCLEADIVLVDEDGRGCGKESTGRVLFWRVAPGPHWNQKVLTEVKGKGRGPVILWAGVHLFGCFTVISCTSKILIY
jgi:hypothetical protein